MTGSASAVKRQLGAGPPGKGERSTDGNGEEDGKKWASLLRNPKFMVKVKRIRPKIFDGVKTNVDVWSEQLPLLWEDIKTEIAETSKGGTYRAAVVDPETGQTIDARTFDIPGPPGIEEAELTPEERNFLGTAQEKDALQINEEGLERQNRLAAKQIEAEGLRQQLEELKSKRTGSSKDDQRIADLERRIADQKYREELDRLERRHAEEIRELKQMLQNSQKPAGSDQTTLLLQQMQAQAKQSSDQFQALIKQMQDDKMNAILQEVREVKNRPAKESGGMLEMAEVMLRMKKIMGWGADGEDDDRPWWEKALDHLGTKLTPKVIDQLFEKFKGIEGSGKEVTKDDFIKNIEGELAQHANKVASQVIENHKAALEKKPAPALPAPGAAALPPGTGRPQHVPIPAAQPVAQAPAATLPAESAPAPSPAPAVQPAEPPSIAKEICLRVAGAIILIEREIEIRPREFNWNFELWNGIPEDVLEKACVAAGPVEMFDAFRVEGISAEQVTAIQEKIRGNPRILAWLKLGHDELREWWERAKEDPSFDPGEEDEGEPEAGNQEQVS